MMSIWGKAVSSNSWMNQWHTAGATVGQAMMQQASGNVPLCTVTSRWHGTRASVWHQRRRQPLGLCLQTPASLRHPVSVDVVRCGISRRLHEFCIRPGRQNRTILDQSEMCYYLTALTRLIFNVCTLYDDKHFIVGYLTWKSAIFVTSEAPWPWPWIGSYGIPSCISHQPLSTYQISPKSEKTCAQTDVRTYGISDPF